MGDDVERPLRGGWVTAGVVRVGGTVRRPRSANAAFVERLLAHLEAVGFDAAPRHLGSDERGRQILTFIEGEVPSDCRALVWSDGQLEAMAALLRRFHDATGPSGLVGQGEVVCHNDFGPWNLVWRDGKPVAIIDFDTAAPGQRADDLGYAVWKALNLSLIDVPVAEQRRRVDLYARAYGAPADAHLLDAIERAQEQMRQVIADAPAGADRDAALEQNDRERAWLSEHGTSLTR